MPCCVEVFVFNSVMECLQFKYCSHTLTPMCDTMTKNILKSLLACEQLRLSNRNFILTT